MIDTLDTPKTPERNEDISAIGSLLEERLVEENKLTPELILDDNGFPQGLRFSALIAQWDFDNGDSRADMSTFDQLKWLKAGLYIPDDSQQPVEYEVSVVKPSDQYGTGAMDGSAVGESLAWSKGYEADVRNSKDKRAVLDLNEAQEILKEGRLVDPAKEKVERGRVQFLSAKAEKYGRTGYVDVIKPITKPKSRLSRALGRKATR
jgi:hypothetical protein